MTIQKALDESRDRYPNRFTDAQCLHWLGELDLDLEINLKQGHPREKMAFEYDRYPTDTEMLVPAPWDEIYVYYLIYKAQITDHEDKFAAETFAQYKDERDGYVKWFVNYYGRQRDYRTRKYLVREV